MNPIAAYIERRARRRWLKRRAENWTHDQHAASAACFLEHPEPVDLGAWRTVDMHGRQESRAE